MLHIAQTQIAREETLAMQSHHWLICDTGPLTTLLYSQRMFDQTTPELEQLATRHYDQVFLCADDFDFVQDGTRRDPAFRQFQQQWYERELNKRGITYTVVSGSVAKRVEQVQRALNPTSKYT